MENFQDTDYTYDMFIIKPNIGEKGKSYSFNENIYEILNHNIDNGPYNDYDNALNFLISYLEKQDYFSKKNVSFSNMLYTIQNFYDPNNNGGRHFDVKTCLDNEDNLIMYMFDASIKDHTQLNYLASILNPTIEPIFGPVFITKILKKQVASPLAVEKPELIHQNFSLKDMADLILSLKQVKYWNFENKIWNKTISFNNNKSVDIKQGYLNFTYDDHMIFFKLKNDTKLDTDDMVIHIIENINNPEVLNDGFENIKVFKIRTGEYVNTQMKYNIDMENIKDIVAQNVINSFNEFDKYQVVMESIFQNCSDVLNLKKITINK